MSTTQRLDPKSLPPTQLNQWMKDSLRLCKRAGALWNLIFTAVITAAGIGIALLFGNTALGMLVAATTMTTLGLLLIPVQIRALDRARRGVSANHTEDLLIGIQDLAANTKWIRSEIIFNFITVSSMILFIQLLGFITPGKPTSKETQEHVATLINIASYFASFGFLHFWFTRKGGFFSMSYFLHVKEGLDSEETKRLDNLWKFKNKELYAKSTGAMMLTFFFMIFLVALLSGTKNLAILGPIVMSISSWFYAAMNHCAWHDIFENGGGLAEKQKKSIFQQEKLLSA